VIVEIARHVLGIEDADHAETNPGAPRLAVTPLACGLVGQSHPVRIVAGTRVAALYGADAAEEDYWCNYGLNPAYRERLLRAGLAASGLDEEGEIRIVELPAHPFFVATLFLPQMRSTPGHPHPVLAGFAAAVASAGRTARA
jgi:CTP synthase (UTP-ammonia lyase)